ncbi:hypothetical protein AB0J72_34795 [Dactylosporangium sp. NPDC049742]|uniref:hypothetical protein n=1 Tax=Dactylosporangium sp. NPDC049742 TaxID=3154737 RepID=UPI00343FC5A9
MTPYERKRIVVTTAELAGWAGRRQGTELVLEGACPACGDATFANLALASTALESTAPVPGPITVSLPCCCAGTHDGRPAGVADGCGREWGVTATVAADGSVTLAAATDAYLLAAAVAVRAEQEGQLQAVRGAADKWTAGVVALIGLVGLVVPAVSRDAIRALEPWAQGLTGVALAVALGCAALAVARAYQAAHGWPVTRVVGDDQALRDWYARYQGRAAQAAGRLRQAVRAAVATIAALAVAVGVTVFGPEAPASSDPVQVTRPDGSVTCGVLLASTADGAVRIRRADSGDVAVLPAADVVRLKPVTAC